MEEFLLRRFYPHSAMSQSQLDNLIYGPLQQALGSDTWHRINRQIHDYEYYGGRQHRDPTTGALVYGDQLPRPTGLDYDPTRFSTNYFKAFIDKKARWLMSGKHGVSVPVKQDASAAEVKTAGEYEDLLVKLWRENKFRTALTKGARDYLIARRTVIKIAYDQATGKLRWTFRPDTEYVPVYDEYDIDRQVAAHFVSGIEDAERNTTLIRKESFELVDGVCYYSDLIYDQNLHVVETIVPRGTLGLDFIPVIPVAVPGLSGEEMDTSEIESMRQITDRINSMNEDAMDALKFEMFAMTALLSVPKGTANDIQIAPGAILEISHSMVQGEAKPDVKRVEGAFKWSPAFDAQFGRLKGALHEVTSLPNVVPQELNFGGLNGDALHVLFQSIIQETEEHWLEWQDALQELHEKSIRYLKARTSHARFSYDRRIVDGITDYYSEVKFALPLPDNRAALVELLALEVGSGFESAAGAMRRLGVEDVASKLAEVRADTKQRAMDLDPYGGVDDVNPDEGGE